MKQIPTRLLCVVLACLPLAILRAVEPVDLNSLLNNSPFGANPAATGPVKADTPIEFRGVFAEGGEYFFNLYISANARSEWLGLNEVYGENLTVKTYDAENQQLSVDYQGRTLTLSLGAAKRTAPPPAPATPALTSLPTPPPVAEPAAPINDQERLAKIADEIRRRRALRQQALQKPTQ